MIPTDLRVVFDGIVDVSRETETRLETYIELLRKWQPALNLVGPKTLPDVWERHVLDSLQLWSFVPSEARTLIDIGSGAGFPGLVLAMLSAQHEGPDVHLVESDTRKSVFLKTVSRETHTPVTVHAGRIEGLTPWETDVITARACAPLHILLEYAAPFATETTVCLFPKGRTASRELTEASNYWTFSVDQRPSKTDPDASILCIRGLSRRA